MILTKKVPCGPYIDGDGWQDEKTCDVEYQPTESDYVDFLTIGVEEYEGEHIGAFISGVIHAIQMLNEYYGIYEQVEADPDFREYLEDRLNNGD